MAVTFPNAGTPVVWLGADIYDKASAWWNLPPTVSEHMQKALTKTNLRLHHVVLNITGATATQIIRAMIAGAPNGDRSKRKQRLNSAGPIVYSPARANGITIPRAASSGRSGSSRAPATK